MKTPLLNKLNSENKFDRIPIRLSSNRKAWLYVPSPFYQTDKERIIKQLEIMVVDEDTDNEC